MALSPVPFVVADSGDVSDAPSGAVPVSLYGADSGGAAVTSVNGEIGAVVLDADSVGALPDDYTPPATTWASVTGKPSTFDPIIGTSATTAMAGDTNIPAAATWANISGKPAVVAAGTNEANARAEIGAGTSNLTLAQSQAGIATKAAIAALTEASTAEEIVAALQA